MGFQSVSGGVYVSLVHLGSYLQPICGVERWLALGGAHMCWGHVTQDRRVDIVARGIRRAIILVLGALSMSML